MPGRALSSAMPANAASANAASAGAVSARAASANAGPTNERDTSRTRDAAARTPRQGRGQGGCPGNHDTGPGGGRAQPQGEGEVVPPKARRAPLQQGRGVLDGAFALLEALRLRGGEAGLTELALACQVPKGSAHRLLEQLGLVGAVERRGNRYLVGPQLFRLGQAWQPYPGLRTASRIPLHRLRASTGASVVLTVLRDELALTVASVPGRVEALVPVRTGLSFPLDTAAGRVFTGRPHGPVLDREQVQEGVSCVAVPVRAPDGRTVAALAAVVPADQGLAAVAAATAAASVAIETRLARTPPQEQGWPPHLLRY
ncbi:helix-turn-helix domain-containing protein [Streptomyces sp. G45]|uniref:helix-turn-helix domain-containing protein n=1 Tax=Streptomyces sp. G45 TaxID=3406627 RepID=UPI003C2A1B8E